MMLLTHPVASPASEPFQAYPAHRQAASSPDVGPVDWARSFALHLYTIAGPAIWAAGPFGGCASMPGIDQMRHRDPGERLPVYFH